MPEPPSSPETALVRLDTSMAVLDERRRALQRAWGALGGVFVLGCVLAVSLLPIGAAMGLSAAGMVAMLGTLLGRQVAARRRAHAEAAMALRDAYEWSSRALDYGTPAALPPAASETLERARLALRSAPPRRPGTRHG